MAYSNKSPGTSDENQSGIFNVNYR